MKTHYVVVSIISFTAVSASAIADDNPMLHPVEAVCIAYQMQGQMQNGTTTRCHREYGYEAYEIQNITIGFGGFTQSQNQHVITIGETIYSIDLSTNTGTQSTNPMYAQLVASLDGQDTQNMSAAFIGAMGFTPSGTTKTIANTDCEVYSSQMMGTACLTNDGLMLEQEIMGNTQVATSVSIGDGGDDANYTLYTQVPITQGPDLSNMPNLQDLMNQVPQN